MTMLAIASATFPAPRNEIRYGSFLLMAAKTKVSPKNQSAAMPRRLIIALKRPFETARHLAGHSPVPNAIFRHQRRNAPAQNLQKIPEVLQTTALAIAQARFIVGLHTSDGHPCLFPND